MDNIISDILKSINKANILKWIGYGIAALTIVADYTNEGLDILRAVQGIIAAGS